MIVQVAATWQDLFAIGRVPCGSHCPEQHIMEAPKGAEQECPAGLSHLSRFTALSGQKGVLCDHTQESRFSLCMQRNI